MIDEYRRVREAPKQMCVLEAAKPQMKGKCCRNGVKRLSLGIFSGSETFSFPRRVLMAIGSEQHDDL